MMGGKTDPWQGVYFRLSIANKGDSEITRAYTMTFMPILRRMPAHAPQRSYEVHGGKLPPRWGQLEDSAAPCMPRGDRPGFGEVLPYLPEQRKSTRQPLSMQALRSLPIGARPFRQPRQDQLFDLAPIGSVHPHAKSSIAEVNSFLLPPVAAATAASRATFLTNPGSRVRCARSRLPFITSSAASSHWVWVVVSVLKSLSLVPGRLGVEFLSSPPPGRAVFPMPPRAVPPGVCLPASS